MQLSKNNHIHIIGIGGAGMSAVARVLLERGVKVSGSDRQANEFTEALSRDGAIVYQGHDACHVDGADAVFVTSAARDDNPEIRAAKEQHIPIFTRREFFQYLLPDKAQIAIAGTHGKTTTTSLIAHLLIETQRDPSYIIGGILHSTGTNAHAGSGDQFVVEADEYGGMFLGLSPQVAVITNIEHDHPDQFPTLDSVIAAFRKFVALLPDDGVLIACADDMNALLLANERRAAGKPVITYGRTADWIMQPQPSLDPRFTDFNLITPGTPDAPLATIATVRRVILSLPGTHNMLNATAALIAAHLTGVSLDSLIPALASFAGTGRRFEVMGEAGGVTVISDYAHHPTAIRATLQATRQRYPTATIWAVWQPHTYSRSRLLAKDFVEAFYDANYAVFMDIYPAREQPQPDDPTGETLVHMAQQVGHGDVRYSGGIDTTAELLTSLLRPSDVVIIFSAGDAPRVGEILLDNLSKL